MANALGGRADGLYVGGSMASGDYRPGISDIDAVALIPLRLSASDRAALVEVHARLAELYESGRVLHCVYVPRGEVDDVGRRHWTWAHGELYRRPLGGIARAELLADPVIAFGPAPSTWLPPVDDDALKVAARAELSGYWARALRKRSIWLEDVYVDLGLTVWARADATISDSVLITKSEAIHRMRSRELPSAIVDGVAARRTGRSMELSQEERDSRAEVVRAFLTREFDRLARRQ